MTNTLPARNKAILAENIRRHKKLCFPGPGSGQRLAAAVGVAPQMISNWLNGSRTPTFEQLHRLAKVFGVSPLELCGIEEEWERPRSYAIAEVLRDVLNVLEHDKNNNAKPHATTKELRRINMMIHNEIKAMKKESGNQQS